MASTFSFGFSGDDIDIDVDDVEVDEVNERSTSTQRGPETGASPTLVEAKRHGMDEWLPTLPSQISYNKLTIHPFEDESSEGSGRRSPLTLARREVFDIRAQLMAEDSAEEENAELIAGLEKGDIKPYFYEGGFKTWECSIDLGRLVGAAGGSGGCGDRHVIELGAGTAVPSLTLFARLLSQSQSQTEKGIESSSSSEKTRRRTHFTFADYNSTVLRLVTLPNLLLTWNYIVNDAPSPSNPDQPESEEKDISEDHKEEQVEEEEEEEEEGELDITPDLIQNFRNDLGARGITVSFISGAWSPAFVDLVFSSGELSRFDTLVLASETIYSPASLLAFSETLLALLRKPEARSRALIAAKKVYFGVGGGVNEFLAVLRGVSGSGLEVKERMDIRSEGVGRILLEIGVGI